MLRSLPASRRILLALLAFHALAGAASAFAPETQRAQGLLNAVLALSLTIAIYTWCRAEGCERGRAPPGRSALWAALLSLIFLPVYFFRTRPKGLALLASLKALGFYLLLSIVLALATFAAGLTRGMLA